MMAPELDLSPGHVLCPACSGLGVWGLGSNGGNIPCRLCETRAQVPEGQAEAFWAAVGELQKDGRQTRGRATWRAAAWRP